MYKKRPFNVDELKKSIYPTGNLIRKLPHTALSDCDDLYDVSVRGDKVVVCGRRGAALFKLTTVRQFHDFIIHLHIRVVSYITDS